MNYDWKSLAPDHTAAPAEHIAYLDQRVAEMSPKEWRIFRAALTMVPQPDPAGAIALTHSLHVFSYYYPVENAEEAGRLLAERNYGARGDVLPFLDHAKVCTEYVSEHGGTFVDGAFISNCFPSEVDRIAMKAESIREYGIPEDDGWTAKLRIAGPSGDEAWLRLPDYEEVNGGEADEVTTLLHDVGADSLEVCTLLEVKCIFPQIDLMAYDGSLSQLVFDASNFGYGIEEYEHCTEHFWKKLENALKYEKCDRLDFAIDIVANLDCYDFVPDKDLRTTAENIMPAKHFKQDIIMNAFDHEAFAADYYRSRGMQEVDGVFFARNDKEFHYDYSLAPEKQAAQMTRDILVGRLNRELNRCWSDYKAMRAGEDPEWLIIRASEIAATEAAYDTYCDGADLSNEMMEKLLQFENPLEILRDAWARGAGHEDERHMKSRLQDMLDDPHIGESYDQLPEFSGRPVEPEQGQQMGDHL